MSAVTAIAKLPPTHTRNAARNRGAPTKWAPSAPKPAKLSRESAAMAGMRQAPGAWHRQRSLDDYRVAPHGSLVHWSIAPDRRPPGADLLAIASFVTV